MTKEHKKLYKAGKNWIVATLTATTITLLGGIGTHTVHADTTIESSQDVQTTSVNQTNQVDNSNDSVTINQPVAVQSSQTAQNDLSVQGNQTNQTVPSSATAAADTSNSDSLDSNIYGTVNVKDWDYQENNHVLNLTNYHGQDKDRIIIPNLNDFSNANIDINGVEGVGITSQVLKNVLGQLNSQNSTIAISKTSGSFSNKVIAENNNWESAFITPEQIKIKYADLTNLDTSNITDMAYMFAGQDHLKVLTGLDSWNTSNVVNMRLMFQNDSSLTVMDLSHWDTSSVTDMASMFCMATNLQSVGDLSNWNTSKVTDMSNMFSSDVNIQTVGQLDNWDTSNVTDMNGMFANMDKLKSVGDLSKWNISNVTSLMGMFDSTNSLQTVGQLDKWDTSNVTDMGEMFYYSHIKTAGDLGKWNTSNVANMNYMFNNAINLQSVGDLSKWNTSKVTDMSCMFYNARNLQSVGDLSKWNTSKVTDMSCMFGSTRFSSIGDLSNWNTGNVTNMSGMFLSDVNLQSVGDLSKWDTSSVTDMSDVLLNSKINYFVVSRYNNSFNNILHLIDSNGLMGQPGETIATIKAPTFYKLEPDGNKNTSVYDTVFPLVQKKANEEYEKFLNGLTEGMRNIYPTKVSLKWVLNRGQVPTPTDNANATFTYNMKIGTLKYFVINYVDKTGNVVGNIVGSEILPGAIGSTVPLPKKLSLPSGYQLVSGQVIPTSVTFKKGKLQAIDIYVEKESKTPVVQKGSINYVDQDGKVIKTDTISGKVGDQINVKLSLPDGYELANKDEQIPSSITVGEDGIKPITIQVKKLPVVQTGSINYVDQDGKVIKTDTISGKVGDQINIKLSLPDGYELANKDEQIPSSITVGEDGIKPITIQVKKLPVVQTTDWQKNANNQWVYNGKTDQDLKGTQYVQLPTIPDTNVQGNTNWYFVKDGIAQSGVQQWAGTYYYFDPTTYLRVDNDYRQSQWGDWYMFGKDGRIATGLYKWDKNNQWYYFDPTTYLAVTNNYIQANDGHWYLFTADGTATSRVAKWAGTYYYFDPQTHLRVDDNYVQSQWGDWYMFGKDGRIATGLYKWDKNNQWYYFNPITYLAVTNDYIQANDGNWYLFTADGTAASRVAKWAGTYYYFDPVTHLRVDNNYVQSQWGDWYLFGNDGRILTGVQKWAGSYYYFDPVTYLKVTNSYRQSQWGDWYMFGPDGRIVSGLYNWLGNLYYFDPVTYLKVTNQYVYVGGVRYWADANGCLSRA
ncbi:BspA family leucine-rich repeat surface protein [Limosilactobacillus fermentum]|uniref:BspA family leucine-rich repeat surface protein n=1 Tax=Limosilactobacillus fermentum TaxID=1613 RepID=UPI001657BE07|nr:BspA family leucine-rich repeat surface protein [Limosilactobacillus fermentum]MBC9022955.1 BspA family leucine-rich repeat surface protein [Limosilactobacillus fermentum CECT 5716]MCB4715083.1 BspA family leucine-rich repeat surface protein [Limosilactobacillus fermentum]MCH5398399.1 BspA family leucine-rich repeat surface protein [Limosilactobacillus fermentum]MDQ7202911.1 BspA family leucine-rich repeat surface protein [Limosilactobacillus fermentum]WCL65959.1 BspA family leucine-rich re